MAEDSKVTIEELSGAGEKEKVRRTLILFGAGLPARGASWPGEQRVSTTWYPGNAAEATQHVLGPIEKEAPWEGIWRTTLLFRTPAEFTDASGQRSSVGVAFDLAQILEDFFRSGLLLRVTWEQTIRSVTRQIVREGRCKSWDFKYDRVDDINWSVNWDWASRGRRSQKAVQFRVDDVGAGLRDVTIGINEVVQAATTKASLYTKNKNVRKSANTFSLGQLENTLNAPNLLVRSFTRKVQQIANRVKHAGELINKVRALPIQMTNQVLDVTNNTVAVCNDFVDTMSRRPPESNVQRVKVSQLARALSYYGRSVTQAQLLRRSAMGLRTQVQKASKNYKTILAVHVVSSGETLAGISLNFYGTPDFGPGIARANNLPLNQLTVARGTVLIVPTLDVVKGFTPQGG